MIEVPERVKDALRGGRYRKNYRFVVRSWHEAGSSVLVTELVGDREYTVAESGNYTFNPVDGQSTFSSMTVTSKYDDSEIIQDIPWTNAGQGAAYEPFVVSLYEGNVISLSGVKGDSVAIERAVWDVLDAGRNMEDFTIDNDTLVKESVKLDERMCSGDTLKFGLCEGTSLEFQYFDHENIRGKELQAFIDVQYKDADGELKWHEIPMGFFTVDQCSTQFSTGIMKVTAYNKLQSKYLDEKANTDIMEKFANLDKVYVSDMLNAMLGEYAIDKDEKTYINPRPQKSTSCNATVTGTFRYKNLYGDHGPMGPGSHVTSGRGTGTVTTSTNMMLSGRASSHEYAANPDYPLKIRLATDFDAIDDAIFYSIIDWWEKADTTVTTDALITRLLNMDIPELDYLSHNSYFTKDISKGWFFRVVVEFKDGTLRTYGNTLYRYGLAAGTFSDLNNITLEYIRAMMFIQPESISIGISSQGVYIVTANLCGENGEYVYYASSDSTSLTRKTYQTPKLRDGSNIPKDGLYKYATEYNVTNLTDSDMITVTPSEIPDVTLRELQSATYETVCQFGKLDRETDLFSGVELNGSRLLPADDLYPDDSLYPNGAAEGSFKSQYSKLWTDAVGVQTFRYLIITYKGLETDDKGNTSEKDFTLQRTVNTHGTTDYNMSDNWLFRNLVWTAEQVGEYADAMVEKMRNISWFPFEMWAAGLPYLETGDELEITTRDGTYTSYILQRQLDGIQNLQDTYINGTLDIF